MKKPISKIVVVTMCMLCIFFAGCSDGFKVGFNRRHTEWAYACGIKSDKSVFDVNDVTLDCYFGESYLSSGSDEPVPRNGVTTDWWVGYGLYWTTVDHPEISSSDYKNIEDTWFIKLVSVEDFTSEGYMWSQARYRDKVYNHHEMLTAPKELFDITYKNRISDRSHKLRFHIAEILYSPEEGNYFVNDGCSIEVRFDFVDSQTVKLYSYE